MSAEEVKQDELQEEENEEEGKPVPEEVYLLYRGQDIYFIPAYDMARVFEKIPHSKSDHEPISVRLNPKIKWHSYSGGWDTYLCSSMLWHGRSCYEAGDWRDRPLTILGVYGLEL